MEPVTSSAACQRFEFPAVDAQLVTPHHERGGFARRMKSRLVDIVLASACWLLTGVVVWLSASGCEQISMVLSAILLSAPVVVLGSVLVGWRRHTLRPVGPAVLVALLSLAIIASVAIWQWPLRVSHDCSRTAFNWLAQRVARGEQVQTPRRVGLFNIRKAEISYNGIVCLWIVPDTAGSTGFVECPRDYVPSNLWSLVKLDDHWQFISEN